MDGLISFLISWWFPLAMLFSAYWGFRSVILFTTNSLDRVNQHKQQLYFLRRKFPRLGTFFIGSYHFLFDSIGSFAGWVCIYALLVRLQSRPIDTLDFTGGDVLLFFISLLGLTGHLPKIVTGLVESIGEMGKKAIEKLTGST